MACYQRILLLIRILKRESKRPIAKEDQRSCLEELRELLSKNSEGMIRVKGFFCDTDMQGYALHFVHGDIELKKLDDYKGNMHLIIMGIDLDLSALHKKLKTLAQ